MRRPSFLQAFCFLLVLGTGSGMAETHRVAVQTATVEYVDGGQLRKFNVAGDELYLRLLGNSPVTSLAGVPDKIPGATVLQLSKSHAVVKINRALNATRLLKGTDEFSVAFPGVEVCPVLYEAGEEPGVASRRVVTRRLLAGVPEGRTATEVGALVNAISARDAAVADVAILELRSAFEVEEALAVLKAAGIPANPLLGHTRGVAVLPTDEFFSLQWHLHNTGQSGSLLGIDVNVIDIWKFGLGAGVTIGIVDSCLQTAHPDLLLNTPSVNSELHYDFLDDDVDPNPEAGDRHGTSVAGVAAARQNNGAVNPQTGALQGVSGVAPEARLIGLRLVSENGTVAVTDEEEARALFWKVGREQTPIIDISNNSWGTENPVGNAPRPLIGPDILAQAALRDATIFGRGGKGQITLFAAGNSKLRGNDANLSGYANSHYVIAVGAIDNQGKQAVYSNSGANLLISAPGGGTLGIVTTDNTDVLGYNPPPLALPGTQRILDLPNTDYTNQFCGPRTGQFEGTSAATPLVSGVVALMLQANPNLGWRDVKEILAATARQVDSADTGWRINTNTAETRPAGTNAAGFRFNNKYGSGMVNASAAVIRAQDWSNLGEELSQEVKFPAAQLPRNIPDNLAAGTPFNFSFASSNFSNLRVEVVEVTVDITHAARSQLDVTLISPSGTSSLLASGTVALGDNANFKYSVFNPKTGVIKPGWTFTSSQFWGENSVSGSNPWQLVVRDRTPGTTGRVLAASVRLYGTPSTAQRFSFERLKYSVLEPEDTAGAADGTLVKDVTLRILRLGGTTGTALLSFATSANGTAVPQGSGGGSADFVPKSDTLFFNDGEAFKDITVSVLNDKTSEPTESIYVLLRSPVGASLGGISVATIDILDNDANLVQVESTDSVAAEPTVGVPANTGTFTISRVAPTAFPLLVRYSIAGTATAGNDYQQIAGVASIPADGISTTVTVLPIDDGTIEGNETVVITLLPDAAYQIGAGSSATVTINDNDQPFVQITPVANALLLENNQTRNATVRISRTEGLALPLPVDLEYSGTQSNGIDYIDADAPSAQVNKALPASVIIPAGSPSVDLRIKTVNDTKYDAEKTIVIGLGDSDNYRQGFLLSAQIIVLEDDPPPSPPDTRSPVIKVNQPRPNTRFVSPAPVNLSGISKDNIMVQALQYRINGGDWKDIPITAAATVSWTLTLKLPGDSAPEVKDGTNVVELRSSDDDGNLSLTYVLPFTYVKETPVQVAVLGNGSVTKGFLGTTTREERTKYTITAQPSPGQVFSQWIGLRSDVISKTLVEGAAATREVQQIDISKIAQGISAFTLSFDGATSLPIPTFTNSGFIQERLNQLSTVSSRGTVSNPGSVVVDVDVGNAKIFKITFNQNGNVPQITGVGLPSVSRTLIFLPEELVSSSLTAEFIATPYVPAIIGNYAAVVHEGATGLVPFDFNSSAFLFMTVTPTGAFTGRLTIGGTTYPLKGEFNGLGRYVGNVPRKNAFPFTLDLTIDLAPAGTQRITGTLGSPTFTLVVRADRAPFSKTSPAPASVAGKQFTIVLPSNTPLTNGETEPDGNGYGTVTVDAAGVVRAAGVLPDGTKFTTIQSLTKDLAWPFFLELYNRRGVAIGLITHDGTQLTTDLSGNYSWFKPAKPGDKYFPAGFLIPAVIRNSVGVLVEQNALIGSAYQYSTGRALAGFADSADNARITLDFGNLANLISKVATLDANNAITINETASPSKGEGLTMKVKTRDGTFSGSFTHPLGGKKVPIQGVLFQKQQTAVGGFLGISIPGVPLQTGRVVLKAP